MLPGPHRGPGMSAVIRALSEWAAGGSALAALVEVVGAVCIGILGLLYRRYLGILGANRRVSAERQDYERLWNSLAEGNMAARLYATRLAKFLDWLDHFFGDARMVDRTLLPHAFGLKTPAPLWTVPSLDCCLFLALLYPIATISAIWAISGDVGPAETALRLQAGLSAWQRIGVVAAIGLIAYGYWRAATERNIWKSLGAMAVSFTGSGIILVSGAVTLAVYGTALGLCFNYKKQASDTRKGMLGIIAVFMALAQNGSAGIWYAALAAIVSGILFFSHKAAVKSGFESIFYWILFHITISAFLLAAKLTSALATSEYTGPALLFLGLLTLLIAPFDWASLGLTRALLRRGLELGGWWPYALALVDATVAAVIIAALGFALLIGVQSFDVLTLQGGGNKPVLGLDALFDGLAAHPTSPEYWWIYTLLLSTLIPSLANLVIGSTSLVRGLPGVPLLLLDFMPKRGGVLKWDRHWIATVLTAQVAAGAFLGIAAQIFLVWVIIGYVMPFFGLELLDMTRGVAAFNLPARMGQFFGAGL
jgi:hypothetical protein